MPAPGLSLDHSRILLGGSVLVYPERTFEVERAAGDSPPRPYGLAPTAIVAADEALVAVATGEAIWLGLQAVDTDRPARLRVKLEGEPPLDAVSGEEWGESPSDDPANYLTCPPDYCLAGARHPDGLIPFTTGKLTLLLLAPVTASASVWIVDLDTFSEATGEEARPLDPESGYGGWRAP